MMTKYAFLYKPLFFIFSLFFASALVLYIEKLEPSDFGRYKEIFESGPRKKRVSEADLPWLTNIAYDFKKGKLDTVMLQSKLREFVTDGSRK
jgi:hypothetical protein